MAGKRGLFLKQLKENASKSKVIQAIEIVHSSAQELSKASITNAGKLSFKVNFLHLLLF